MGTKTLLPRIDHGTNRPKSFTRSLIAVRRPKVSNCKRHRCVLVAFVVIIASFVAAAV